MSTDNIKKRCAKEALQFIHPNTIIGLGGGSTIAYLINYIQSTNLAVKIVTPSTKTRMLCINNGLEVLPTSSVEKVSVAFDGCDEVDEQLFALKSGGGIHTKEKLIANMAEEYILLIDESKFVPSLTCKHPIVLEILEDSLTYVEKKIHEIGGKCSIRHSAEKDGYTISDNGNLLMDVHFEKVDDFTTLQEKLKSICGVVETSLFTKEVTKVLIAKETGFQVISKNNDGVIA
ncbi:ribose 5-phosphate isomerase A [Niallia sp. 01092]|uniref:ribose 5-phosphate isomerase A n=1 Tax=unclassified Niallia TaxID=2837522 RepID=UPI003FD00CD5